jgi:hypothetical protein
MKLLSLISAGALVLIADAFVLVGVSINRSGTTEEIELTERELSLQVAGEDNTGVSLRLNQIGVSHYLWLQLPDKPDWFDQAKLAEIGFDVRLPLTDPAAEIRYRDVLPRDAFAVLEYGGPRWEEWVKQAEESSRRIAGPAGPSPARPAWDPRNQTHLVAVDAGREPAALRHKYPDPAKHLIVRAVVRLFYQKTWDPATHQLVPPKLLRGEIQAITPDEIHVPLPQAAALSGLRSDRRTARYAVTLRYGTRYEPWVVKIRRM